MIPASFDYHKATSLEEALSLLEKHGYDAKLLAGGHSLIPAIKLRLNRPAILIDISGIAGLNAIVEDGDDLVIGANCTHHDLMTSELVQNHLGVLASAAGMIGDIQIRNRGTIGGSLAHADPASDYPATVLATRATIEVMGPNGQRSIAADDFFEGIYTTALADNEIIIAIRFPKCNQGVYHKFFQSASRFAVVGCAIVVKEGKIQVGITGVSDVPYRAKAVEEAFAGDAAAAAAHAVDGVEVLGDHFASEEYRSHLAKVYTERAINDALGDDY